MEILAIIGLILALMLALKAESKQADWIQQGEDVYKLEMAKRLREKRISDSRKGIQ